MLDLKDKGCTILLALPEKANQNFMNGFHAAWYVSGLVQVGEPKWIEELEVLGRLDNCLMCEKLCVVCLCRSIYARISSSYELFSLCSMNS